MGAIFRADGNMVPITPTAKINAGDVVAIGADLVGVAFTTIEANAVGYVNTRGEYDVAITAGTAYDAGATVSCAGVTLAGEATTVEFGPAIKAVTATDAIARCLLNGIREKAAAAESGSGSGSGAA